MSFRPNSWNRDIYPQDNFWLKKWTMWWDLVMLPYLRGLGVLHNEFEWLKWPYDEGLMNSWRLRPCSWFLSKFLWCPWIRHLGISQCIPVTQKLVNVMPPLNVAPMAWHWMNLHWFLNREAHLNTKWGVHQLQWSFFDFAHCEQWLYGDECTFAERRSTFIFVLYGRYHIKNTSIPPNQTN